MLLDVSLSRGEMTELLSDLQCLKSDISLDSFRRMAHADSGPVAMPKHH